VAKSVLPIARVGDTLLLVDVGPLPVAQPVEYLTLVVTPIGPVVTASPSDLILRELALVFRSVDPLELAPSVEQPVPEFTFEFVALPELAGSVTVVDFAYLKG